MHPRWQWVSYHKAGILTVDGISQNENQTKFFVSYFPARPIPNEIPERLVTWVEVDIPAREAAPPCKHWPANIWSIIILERFFFQIKMEILEVLFITPKLARRYLNRCPATGDCTRRPERLGGARTQTSKKQGIYVEVLPRLMRVRGCSRRKDFPLANLYWRLISLHLLFRYLIPQRFRYLIPQQFPQKAFDCTKGIEVARKGDMELRKAHIIKVAK